MNNNGARDWVKFVGYFDVAGMSTHQAIAHLTDRQQENYKAQICAALQQQHFEVDRFHIELAVVVDQVLAYEQSPGGPFATGGPLKPVTLHRHRLQYTVSLKALPAPATSGLILPGQENGLAALRLVPLPEEEPTP